jgi:hypothetical protein
MTAEAQKCGERRREGRETTTEDYREHRDEGNEGRKNRQVAKDAKDEGKGGGWMLRVV